MRILFVTIGILISSAPLLALLLWVGQERLIDRWRRNGTLSPYMNVEGY